MDPPPLFRDIISAPPAYSAQQKTATLPQSALYSFIIASLKWIQDSGQDSGLSSIPQK